MVTRIKMFSVSNYNYRIIFTETKILVYFYKKKSRTSSSFSMTFQSSKMVLLNSTTFQEEWSPWTTVGPQFSGELFSRHLTEQQPSAVIHLNAPRKVYPYVAYVSPLPNGGTGVSTGSSHSMHYYNYCSLCQMQVYPTCTAVACFCSVFSFQFA